MGFYFNSDCNYSRGRDFNEKVYHYTFRFLFVLSNSTKYLTQTSEQAVYGKNLGVSVLPEIKPSQTLNWSNFEEKRLFGHSYKALSWQPIQHYMSYIIFQRGYFKFKLYSFWDIALCFIFHTIFMEISCFLVIWLLFQIPKTCNSAFFNISKNYKPSSFWFYSQRNKYS